MSQWHTAEATNAGLHVVIHFLVPPGNNAVGVTWKAAALKAGLAGKTASVWADPAEAAAILAGDVIEIESNVSLNREAALATQRDVVQAHVDRAIAAKKLEFAGGLKYAGYGEGTVV
jgi:hypothetical protein